MGLVGARLVQVALPHLVLSGTADGRVRERDQSALDGLRPMDFLRILRPSSLSMGSTAEGYVLKPGSEAEAVLGRAHEKAMANGGLSRYAGVRSTTECLLCVTAHIRETSMALTNA